MSLVKIGRSPLGALRRSPLGALRVAASRFIAVGNFVQSGCRGIAKWDGVWSVAGFGAGINGGAIYAVADWSSLLVVVGTFASVDGVAAVKVAGWSGGVWQAIGTFPNANPLCVAEYDGDLYVGGFGPDGDTTGLGIWDGAMWSDIGADLTGRIITEAVQVRAMAVYDGQLFIGGVFHKVNGIVQPSLAVWNGTAWSGIGTLGYMLPAQPEVNTIVNGGGYLWIGGRFSIGGTYCHVARWDGATLTPVGTSEYSGAVNTLVWSDGVLYAFGEFGTIGGVAALRAAKWDGATWAPIGSGLNDDAYAAAVSNGVIAVGGNFTTAGGNAASRVAQTDGSTWSTFGGGLSAAVYGLAAVTT